MGRIASLRGSKHALLQILVLSFALEAFVIASPFFLQLTVDEVIARGDIDLLIVLALGFGLLTAIKVASNAIRSLIILIVRLPIAYFEKRHIGDILSRFTSIEPIRTVLAEGMIAAAIDGVMAILTLAMIFVYSVQLGLVVLGVFGLYAGLRFGLYRLLRERSRS